MTDKNFKTIKAEIAGNLENHYEDTIKAIIAIEKNLTDEDMIDYVYNEYMEGEHMLLNDCIDNSICKYEQNNYNREVNSRKTLEDVKNEIDSYKNISSTINGESKEVYNQKFER
jgi:hypothetical protein